jgi:hypothetical protein
MMAVVPAQHPSDDDVSTPILRVTAFRPALT